MKDFRENTIPFDQRDGYIWFDGKIVPWKDAKIHVLTHGLHYGSCVFEGERSYNGTISKQRAESKVYYDAMMLDWEGRVSECTGANIFFIKDGELHTPIADCFLNGITRQTVIGLAKEKGMKVVERRLLPEALKDFT